MAQVRACGKIPWDGICSLFGTISPPGLIHMCYLTPRLYNYVYLVCVYIYIYDIFRVEDFLRESVHQKNDQ